MTKPLRTYSFIYFHWVDIEFPSNWTLSCQVSCDMIRSKSTAPPDRDLRFEPLWKRFEKKIRKSLSTSEHSIAAQQAVNFMWNARSVSEKSVKTKLFMVKNYARTRERRLIIFNCSRHRWCLCLCCCYFFLFLSSLWADDDHHSSPGLHGWSLFLRLLLFEGACGAHFPLNRSLPASLSTGGAA